MAQKGIASPAALGSTTNGAGSRLSTISNYSDVSVPVYATVKGVSTYGSSVIELQPICRPIYHVTIQCFYFDLNFDYPVM